MYKERAHIDIKNPILDINIIDGIIFIVDNLYNLHRYNIETFLEISHENISTLNKPRHSYNRAIKISNEKDIAAPSTDKNDLSIYLFGDKLKLIDTLHLNDGEVSVTNIRDDARVLGFGGDDGKTFFYDLKYKHTIFSLAKRADAIHSIVFNEENNYGFVASYNNLIEVFDFTQCRIISKIKYPSVIEDGTFIDERHVLVVSRDNTIRLIDVITKKITNSHIKFKSWPTRVIKLSEKYSGISTRDNNFYIIDHTQLKIVNTITLSKNGVNVLYKYINLLFVGFIDGTISIIDTHYNLDELKINLELNKFEEGTKFIEENIFLITHELCEIYDEKWPTTLNNAKTYLLQNNTTEANKIVKPFMFNLIKKEEYDFHLEHTDEYTIFKNLIDLESYIKAYQFADKKVFLKESDEYKFLQYQFEKMVKNCKLLFKTGEVENIEKAKRTLQTYAQIESKSELINGLISKYKDFILADELIQARDFKGYLKLVESRPILKEDSVYNKVLLIGEYTYNKLIEADNKQNFVEAHRVAEYLKGFHFLAQRVQERVEDITLKEKMLQYIQNKDVSNIYKIAQSNTRLELFPPFIQFHKRFAVLYKNAREDVESNNLQKALDRLKDYLMVEFVSPNISNLVKIGYMKQIKQAKLLQDAEVNWVESFNNYTSFFGKDSEYQNFDSKYKINSFCDASKITDGDEFGYESKLYLGNIIVYGENKSS